MGLFSRKSYKIAHGLKLNVSPKEASITVGSKHFHVTKGTNGTSAKFGLLKVKISPRKKAPTSKRRTSLQKNNSRQDAIQGSILLGWIIGGFIFVVFNSFWIALIVTFLIPLICVMGDTKQTTETENEAQCEEICVPLSQVNSVRKRLNRLYPNAAGLYPNEILILEILPGLKIYEGLMKVNAIAPKYGINGVWDLVKDLITERGYLKLKDGRYELTERGQDGRNQK